MRLVFQADKVVSITLDEDNGMAGVIGEKGAWP